jgi:hypothetical protein
VIHSKPKLSNSWIRGRVIDDFFPSWYNLCAPLGSDPRSQLAFSLLSSRNIAVPLDFAMVGKLAQTVFPDGVPPLPSEAEGGFDVDSFWE